MSHIAVIDIGKTNAKLALVNRDSLDEIAVLTRPNTVIDAPPWPHFDVEGHWAFLLDGMTKFHASHGIDVISVTTHGACAALIGKDGNLAAPILDYEHTGPETTASDYNALRPSFAETGSPRLPMGLNLGAQLHWQFQQDPGLHARTRAVVTYPQYWGYRLTGEVACDVTSLGCHTDLWTPLEGTVSSLVDKLGLRDKIAPAHKPGDVLGTVVPEVAARTGLAPTTPVLCGIHDSNASLLPHILRQEPPFSVVSTGTWVIVMTVGAHRAALDPARDVLINVNALGQPVPSARFMGGREFEIMLGPQAAAVDGTAMDTVAHEGPMLMPAVVSDSGPFQGRRHHWIGAEPAPATPERSVAVSFYLALMTACSLSLTAHQGPVIVEGPFASNPSYCAMLAAASGCPVDATRSATGTSQGAALLADMKSGPALSQPASRHAPGDFPALADYAKRWRAAL